MNQGDIFAIHCNECAKTTANEAVACHHSTAIERTEAGVILDTEREHNVLICQECGHAQLRSAKRIEQLSEEVSERFIPPHPKRVLPSWVQYLPSHVGGLLKETHVALANENYWLVAMGGRTLIDMFALHRIGDIGGFKSKLDRLEKEQYLSGKDKLVVEAAVEIGHEATHRNERPSFEDCERALDIVENLLHRLVIEVSASEIREARAKPAL